MLELGNTTLFAVTTGTYLLLLVRGNSNLSAIIIVVERSQQGRVPGRASEGCNHARFRWFGRSMRAHPKYERMACSPRELGVRIRR